MSDSPRPPDPDDRLRDHARPPAAAAGGTGRSWARRPVTWAVVVVVVALVAGALFVFVGSDEASAGEVILEPAGADGDDPFFDSVATSAVQVESGGVEDVTGGQDAVESLGGDTPGLYGGTGDDTVCDTDGLVAFLVDNPEKASAFARPLGISPSDIEEYVAGLTPVLLREDTRVTNHGYANGRATPRQAVFEAGTAVMVDDRGVPRVRCACGNPLTEPSATTGAPAFEGDPWAGFDDARLVAVAPAAEPQTEFDLVNVTTGEPYAVAVAAGGELVLAPDGLGVATFGQPRDQVVATLTGIFGEPDSVEEGTPNSGVGGFAFYQWGNLSVSFRQGAFTEYSFGPELNPDSGTVEPFQPEPGEEDLMTPDGVGIGASRTEAEAAYPVVYVLNYDSCFDDTPLPPQDGLGAFAPNEFVRLYLTPERHGLYVNPLIDDAVWRIGATYEDPGLFCVP